MQISCIYKITSPSNKVYIGSTINFKERIRHYKCLDCKAQSKLYNSLKKYGFKKHKIEILEFCDIHNLYQKERYYGELFNSCGINGLNLSLPGYGDIKSIISEETRMKKRISQTGEGNNFYGKKHTEETKRKISNANSGRKHSEDVRRRVSQNSARHNSKIVVDLETGIFYNSAKEASIYKCIPHSTLRSRLNGGLKNITMLKYAEK